MSEKKYRFVTLGFVFSVSLIAAAVSVLFGLELSLHPQPLAFSVAPVSDEPVYGGPALVAGKPLAN